MPVGRVAKPAGWGPRSAASRAGAQGHCKQQQQQRERSPSWQHTWRSTRSNAQPSGTTLTTEELLGELGSQPLPHSPAVDNVDASGSASAEREAGLQGDGMTTALPPPAATAAPTSRRSWYTLSRRGGGRGPEAAPPPRPEVSPDHEVLRLLRGRVETPTAPGERGDGARLGLVVEGGGMRGAVSGGALQALCDLGLGSVFDAVYGSSAGAINSAYFLSGQREGVHIYHDHIANAEFISLNRLWRKGAAATPVLNLPYLVDYVMQEVSPLRWDAVLSSPVPLKVVASCLDSLAPVILQDFASPADLAACLKASAMVPEIAGGGPLLHRGQRLVDAAVFEPVPFRSAIADGCTHVLVLCTRPRPDASRSGVIDRTVRGAVEAAVKRALMSPAYMVAAWKAEVQYLTQDGLSQDEMLLRSLDEDAPQLPWFAGSHVLPVYPGPASDFSPLCIDPATLRGGVAEGRRALAATLALALGDLLDFSSFSEQLAGPEGSSGQGAGARVASSIVPLQGERRQRQGFYARGADFSHHA